MSSSGNNHNNREPIYEDSINDYPHQQTEDGSLSFPERQLTQTNRQPDDGEELQEMSNNNNNNNSNSNNNNNAPMRGDNDESPATPKNPNSSSSKQQQQEQTNNKKKKVVVIKKKKKKPEKPALPPMMKRRDVSSFNIVAAVLCGMLAPGIIVINSMLASAASFLAPYGESVLGSISGIFLIVGIILFVVPIWFFFLSGNYDRLYTSFTIREKPDSIETENNNNNKEDDDNQQQEEEIVIEEDEELEDPSEGPLPEPSCLQLTLRWTLRTLFFLLLLICLIACLFGVVIHSMKSNVPHWNVDYSEVNAPSGNRVTLQRDEHGVVHIFAQTRRDYFFAFGFAQAQDRLFQLELSRLVGKGKLAKYTGTSGLSIDKLMRTLRLKESADKMYSTAPSYIQEQFGDFAAGINAYLKSEFARPAEFMFLGQYLEYHEPEPFTAQDIFIFIKLIQYQLSASQINTERRRMKNFFSKDFPGEATYENLEAYFYDRLNIANETTQFSTSDLGITVGSSDYNTAVSQEEESFALEKRLYNEVIFPKYRTTSSTGDTAYSRSKNQQQQQSKFSENNNNQQQYSSSLFSTQKILNELIGDSTDLSDASNAWAARSTGGNAVHASDPHLANTVPSVWYFAHVYIKEEDFHISGACPVGSPLIVNGRTDFIRFGNTLSVADQGDLFFMVADPSNPDTHYMHNGVSKEYTVYKEKIEVFGGDDYDLTVRVAPEYGPDVADAMKIMPEDKTSSDFKASDGTPIRITAFMNCFQLPDNNTAEAFYNMTIPATKTVSDFRRVAQEVVSPGLMMVLSDEQGGIGMVMTAAQKIRASGHTGRVPTLGNGTFDYVGDVPLNENPSKVDETSGLPAAFVWSANSRPHPTGYKYSIGYDFRPYRGRVIENLLSLTQSTDAAKFSSASWHQQQMYNESSGFWLFAIQRDLELTNSSSTNGAAFFGQLDSTGSARWNHLINNWDGVASIGSTEVSDLWLWVFTVAVDADPIIKSDYNYQQAIYVMEYFLGLAGNPTPRQISFCGEQLSESSPTALTCVRWVASKWNSVVSSSSKYRNQKWATEDSKIFSSMPVEHLAFHGSILEFLFSRKLTKGGDFTTINYLNLKKGSSTDNPDDVPFYASQGPSARWVYVNVNSTAVASNSASSEENIGFYFNFPAGNSGNLFSEFYFDSADDYVNQKFRKMRHFVKEFGGDDSEDKRQVLG